MGFVVLISKMPRTKNNRCELCEEEVTGRMELHLEKNHGVSEVTLRRDPNVPKSKNKTFKVSKWLFEKFLIANGINNCYKTRAETNNVLPPPLVMDGEVQLSNSLNVDIPLDMVDDFVKTYTPKNGKPPTRTNQKILSYVNEVCNSKNISMLNWQKSAFNLVNELSDREVLVVSDPEGGCGKSVLRRYLVSKLNF